MNIYIYYSLFFFINIYSCYSQFDPEKKNYIIDFKELRSESKNTDLADEKEQNDSFSSGLVLPNTPHHLSVKAISGFDFKSNLNLENFGKLPPKKIAFGKKPESYKYITSQQPRFLNQEKGSGKVYLRDQYLGDITTKGEFIVLKFRDFSDVDGDAVRLFANDKIIVHKVFMTNSYSVYKLKLTKGFNKIDFMALNQGSYAPNTAQLKILDDKANIIFNNKWNLSTGFKAIVIIIKE